MRKSIRSFVVFMAAGLLVLGGSGCSPQARKVSHLKQADRFFDAGQFEKAEIEYMNVLQIEPLNPQAISRLGLIYFDQGRLGRVMPFLIKGRELQPENLDLRLKLGLVDLASGKLKEAQDEASFILDRKPLDEEAPLLLVQATSAKPEEIEATRQRLLHLPAPAGEGASVLVALGTLEFRQRHLKEAETAFRRALVQNPQASAAQAAMAAWYQMQNDLPQAELAFKRAADLAPTRSPRALLYAKFKVQNGDAAAGRKALEEITRRTPDYLPAWILLAELVAAEKKYAESAALLAKVLARDPVHPEALLLSAQQELAQGEKEKAVAELEKLLKIYPQYAQAHYLLGQAQSAGGDLNAAAASLNRAISLAPGFAEAVVLLAELNLRKGDYRLAIAALRAQIQQRPDIAQARFLLAEAFRSQGDLDEALSVYRQLEESFPHDPQASYWKGTTLLQQNKRDEARQAFGKALTLAPDYLLAVEQLLNIDLSEKDYAQALLRAEAQIAKDPKQAGPYLLQAKVFMAQTEVAKAENALRKAIELQPEAAAPYLLLARLYAGSNQLEKALANFQAVSAKNPRNVEALMLIGTIQTQQKNFPGARQAYEKLLDVNPNFSPALNNLAYLYSEQFNELDKAQEMALKAKELMPHEPHSADTLAWILYKKRQYPWALSLLLDSAAKLPDSAEVQFHLGMTQYMMGEEAAARNVLHRALNLDKDFPGSADAQQCLSILAIDATTAGTSVLVDLERTVTQRPDDPVALARLGAIYARGGMGNKAVKAYLSALQASPKNVTAMTELIRLYAAQGETAKAFDLAKKARKLDPDDPEIAHILGRLAYQSGDCAWAASLLQEAARKQPDSADVLFDLAEASYSLGQVAAAESTLQSALQKGQMFLRSNEAKQLLFFIGLTASPGEAVKHAAEAEQILKTEPDYVPALMVVAMGKEQASENLAATQNYEKVLWRFPDFTPAKIRLAVLGAAKGKFDQRAYDFAVQTRADNPDDRELAKAFGVLTFLKGDYAQAVNLLKKSSLARSEDAELWFYLGLAHLRVNAIPEGRKALQRSLNLGLRPNAAEVAQKAMAEAK